MANHSTRNAYIRKESYPPLPIPALSSTFQSCAKQSRTGFYREAATQVKHSTQCGEASHFRLNASYSVAHPSFDIWGKAVKTDTGLLPFQRPTRRSMEDSTLLVELYRLVFRILGWILLWVTRFYKRSLLTDLSESGVRHPRLVCLQFQMGLVAHTQPCLSPGMPDSPCSHLAGALSPRHHAWDLPIVGHFTPCIKKHTTHTGVLHIRHLFEFLVHWYFKKVLDTRFSWRKINNYK